MAEAESIGEQLKAARIERELSIDDVAEQTRIRSSYIVALENDNHEAFPADFYALSFLRQYSDALGLASEDLVNSLRQELVGRESTPEESTLHHAGASSHGLWEAAAGKIRRWAVEFVHNRSNMVVASCLLFVGGVGWWYVGQSEFVAIIAQADAESAEAGSATEPDAEIAAPPALEPARGLTPTTKVSAAPAEAVQSSSAGTLGVELRASGEVWVRMMVDGGSPQQALLQAGNRRTLQAQERVQFTAGNAGAITLVVDGQVQGAIGALGQVRHIQVERDGWKAIPPGSF